MSEPKKYQDVAVAELESLVAEFGPGAAAQVIAYMKRKREVWRKFKARRAGE